MKLLRKTLSAAIRHPATAVVIARHPCLLLKEQREKVKEPIKLDLEKCTLCKLCYDLGCPAIDWKDDVGPIIDEVQCVGCEMCASLCHPDALYMEEVHQ